MTETSDLQHIKTLGDSPIDPQIEDELDDNDELQQHIHQREFKTSLNYFQKMKNSLNDPSSSNYVQAQPTSLNSNVSLTQLMGAMSPKEFARQFVYGDKKIQNKLKSATNLMQSSKHEPYSNIGKENISNNLCGSVSSNNNNQRFSVNQQLLQQQTQSNQKDSEIILQQRSTDCFNREGQKNSISVTLYTELSKQILNDYGRIKSQKNNSISLNPFSPNQSTELLLSPDKVEKLARNPPPKEYEKYQQQLIQRLHSEKDDIETKKLILMQQYLNNEKEKCTFTPQINRPSHYHQQSQQISLNTQQQLQQNQHVQSLCSQQNEQIVLTTLNNNQNNNNNSSERQLTSPKRIYEQTMKIKEQYNEKLEKKKREREEQEEAELQSKPNISKKSQILAQHRHQDSAMPENVVDRLSTMKKRNQSVDVAAAIKQQEQEATFTPQITLKSHLISREQKVEDLLYQDAQRRKNKRESMETLSSQKTTVPTQHQQQQQQQLQTSTSYKLTTKSSNRSNGVSSLTQNKITKAATNKFIKDFNQTLKEIMPPQDENDEIINYEKMVELLQKLGFVETLKSQDSSEEQQQQQQLSASQLQKSVVSQSAVVSPTTSRSEFLIKNMWAQLNGVQNNYVLKRNLLLLLLIIQSLYTDRSYVPLNDHQISQTQLKKISSQNLKQIQQQQQDQRIPSALMPDERPPAEQSSTTAQQMQKPQYINISVHLNSANTACAGKLLNSQTITPQSSQQQVQQQDQLTDNYNSNGQQWPQSQQQSLEQQQQLLLQGMKVVGSFDLYQNLVLSESDLDQLRKIYTELVMRRLSNNDKKSFKSPEKQMPFSPQISNVSKLLALNKRERLVENIRKNQPEIVNIDLNYLLCYQQYQTEAEKNSLKQQFQESELSNCTFRPITKDFTLVEKILNKNKKKENEMEDDLGQYSENRKVGSSTKALGAHRTLELYSLTKPSNQKRDRNKVEIEYEKECDECTFQPDITISQQKAQNSTKQSMIRDVDKNIQRFQKARLNQQTLQNMINQGNTFNQKKLQNLQKNVEDNLEREQVQKQEKLRERLEIQSLRRNTSPNRSSGQRAPYQKMNNQDNKLDFNNNKNKNFQKDNELEQNDILQFEDNNNNYQKTGCSSKTQEDDRIPLLFVDVNIEEDKQARIVVYEGEKSEDLATRFANEHNLDITMKNRLKDLLDMQINSLLSKIEEEHEEHNSDSEITK